MIEVIPGIHRLQLPIPDNPLEYVNVYLVQGDNGYLLVDAGWNTEEALSSLERQLADIGLQFESISQILITHIHPDHYGLAGKLRQLSQAKISLHHLEKDFIESRYVHMDKLLSQMQRWLDINGVPPDEVPRLQTASVGVAKFVAPASPDTTFQGGETINTGFFTFKVIWTPGHSPGHISLYEPSQKFLLSGDHILPTITPNVGLHPQSGSNPLGDYLNSLGALKQLEVKLILPGHEHPFTGLKQRIEEIIEHHQQRNDEILASMKVETKTAYQIATTLTWMTDVNGAGWQDLAPFDKRLAVMETIAHLEAMRHDGKINEFLKDDTIYYQLA